MRRFFFFKQKTAYEIPKRDWSSDVCSSDLAATVIFFRANHILKKNASGVGEVALTRARFRLNCLEDEVCRINLVVRMRIRNANFFSFILKDQHVLDLCECTELAILFLPHAEQVFDRKWLELREGETVIRTVTDYACDSRCRSIEINAGRLLQSLRRVEADAWMIVIKDKRAGVVVVSRTTDAQVAGTQVAVGHIFG